MNDELEYLKLMAKNNEIHQKKMKKTNYIDEKLIKIVENFIIEKELVCYGGIAINSILPKNLQFYDNDIDIPDYDFFSKNALEDAKELSDIFIKQGYDDVEAKSAFFHGTYKVFVNFIPIADITHISDDLFDKIKKNSFIRQKIRYCDPNFLRMSLYQELSRPLGDTSRWEKVYNRLSLLNSHFQFVNKNKKRVSENINETKDNIEIYNSLKKFCSKYKFPICGEYAIFLFSRLTKNVRLKKSLREKKVFQMSIYVNNITQFKNSFNEFKQLKNNEILKNLSLHEQKLDYKYMNNFYTLEHDGDVLMFVFLTNACISYNSIKYRNTPLNIVSIDGMLSLYFGLIITEHKKLNMNNLYLYCFMLYHLVHQEYKGHKLMTRFSLPCTGKQQTYEDIINERSKKYKELRSKPRSKEYEKYFLKYMPKVKNTLKNTSTKIKSKKNKTTKI